MCVCECVCVCVCERVCACACVCVCVPPSPLHLSLSLPTLPASPTEAHPTLHPLSSRSECPQGHRQRLPWWCFALLPSWLNRVQHPPCFPAKPVLFLAFPLFCSPRTHALTHSRTHALTHANRERAVLIGRMAFSSFCARVCSAHSLFSRVLCVLIFCLCTCTFSPTCAVEIGCFGCPIREF